MDMNFHVPIKVWLSPEVYRELSGHAQQRKTDVGGIVARLAAASLKPPRRSWKRLTPEMLQVARDMRYLEYTWHVIADHLGCSVAGLRAALAREQDAVEE